MDEFKKFIPGFFQGITRVTISYPFDVIKVNMQTMHFQSLKNATEFFIKNDPYRFYRGSSLMYTTVSLERSIQFYLLEKLNEKRINPFLSGYLTSILSSVYTIPAQYVSTNIAINKEKNLHNYIRKLYNTKTNVYKGYMLETFKTQIGSTLFTGSYFTLRNMFGENNYVSPFYGGISSIFLWSIIYPIDTIRTEYQTNNISVKQIIKNRVHIGLKSFYKGYSSVLVRSIPSSTLGMIVYEKIKNYLK